MKSLLIFYLILLTSIACLQAQVVNTEKLRTDDRDKNFLTDINLTLGASSNKAGQTLRYGFRARLEYLYDRQKLLLFGGADLTQFTSRSVDATPVNFTNKQYAHLRYNYDFTPTITGEAFSQYQFDQIQLIKNRVLSGVGSRFRVAESDSFSLYLGLIYMYEYEEEFQNTTEPKPTLRDEINRDHRLSTYVSLAFLIQDYVSINHVTYYQPRVDQFSDYRILSETELDIAVNENISLTTYFQYIYDSRPPDPVVPRTMYSITTGLGIKI
ncbi:MAG: DUF481 domain-containing protein [Bacteroidota bacterium]